jgi:hypothetical protein
MGLMGRCVLKARIYGNEIPTFPSDKFTDFEMEGGRWTHNHRSKHAE